MLAGFSSVKCITRGALQRIGLRPVRLAIARLTPVNSAHRPGSSSVDFSDSLSTETPHENVSDAVYLHAFVGPSGEHRSDMQWKQAGPEL